jgi:Glutaredoxin-like domain (DUF836)
VIEPTVPPRTGTQDVAPRVRLLSRPGCHLCDDARAVIAAICADLGVDWSEQDITGDPGLLDRYWEQIPVTFVDGRQHEARLRCALTT